MTKIFHPAPRLVAAIDRAIPLHLVGPDTLASCLAALPETAASWAVANGFKAALGTTLVLPDANGQICAVLLGKGDKDARARARFICARAGSLLPAGTYVLAGGAQLAGADSTEFAAQFALGWLFDQYLFTNYKAQTQANAALVVPAGVDAEAVHRLADAEYLARDLINTPAEDLGPDGLQRAVQMIAQDFGARLDVTEGEGLLQANLPLIHTVGRAGARAPRLLDLRWGEAGPRLTLVGKGVCFDTGGLNIKPGASMGLMKKDMGGAANVLALARSIMASGWPVRLRVLIPAVENNIAANAFRPSDVFRARNGLTVEINNTDAEGRLVLADALALAAEEAPDQIVSMATLTGAARVALGPDIAPFFTDQADLAAALAGVAPQVEDPVWQLPFHAPYEALIEPGIADLDNAPKGGMAGAITAALFLRRFTDQRPYTHFDIFGWTPTAAPARPMGGAGQGWRALFAALPRVLKL